jgi:hypothetical protein
MAEKTYSRPEDRISEEERQAIIELTGPAAAAMVAGGVGVFMVGLMTTLAEASQGIADALNLYAPVGPLSGKTIVAVVTWLLAWFFLNMGWKDRNPSLQNAFRITIILILAGLLLTFPPFFELFAGE